MPSAIPIVITDSTTILAQPPVSLLQTVSGELVQMVRSIGFEPVDTVSLLRQSKATRSLTSAPQGLSQNLSPAVVAILKAVLTAGLYPQVNIHNEKNSRCDGHLEGCSNCRTIPPGKY